MLNKLKTNINDLQSVNLIEYNWKLVDNIFNIDTFNNDDEVYIGIFENKIENKPKWNIISWKNIIGEQKLWLHVYK